MVTARGGGTCVFGVLRQQKEGGKNKVYIQ
jgi:hypothetical protein